MRPLSKVMGALASREVMVETYHASFPCRAVPYPKT